MGDVIRFRKPEDRDFAECAVCGATVYHITIADDPDDEDCFLLTGMECACCHSFTDLDTFR